MDTPVSGGFKRAAPPFGWGANHPRNPRPILPADSAQDCHGFVPEARRGFHARRAPASARPRAGYDPPMAERADLQQQLEEIGTQLDWVRDYL